MTLLGGIHPSMQSISLTIHRCDACAENWPLKGQLLSGETGSDGASARAALKAVERLKTADGDGWTSATEALIEMSSAEEEEERKWRPTRENYELQADYFFR